MFGRPTLDDSTVTLPRGWRAAAGSRLISGSTVASAARGSIGRCLPGHGLPLALAVWLERGRDLAFLQAAEAGDSLCGLGLHGGADLRASVREVQVALEAGAPAVEEELMPR